RLINRYQLPLVISAWAAVFSVIAIVPGITGHLVLFLVTLWGGFAIAYVSYAMSLRSAQDYGVALRSAFDVYRDRLVESWPPREYVESDRGRFRRLREFVVPKVPSSPGTVQGSQLGGEGEKQGREPLRDEGSKS